MAGPRNISLLDLMHYRFPIMAISSILHRISGLILFLYIPVILYALGLSLKSPEDFQQLHLLLLTPWARFLTWVCLSALAYHVLAGIRHLIMNFGYFEGLKSGRISSATVIGLAAICIVALGVWAW
ncbi:MAG: succinate dehydrogenase, cytochrome b556 subunit [Gammaproteobacteria bacterium]|nr:succinate dehydrogenase, cytochrome b556 subunit [Gammaproteobacteria bacterium]